MTFDEETMSIEELKAAKQNAPKFRVVWKSRGMGLPKEATGTITDFEDHIHLHAIDKKDLLHKGYYTIKKKDIIEMDEVGE